MRNLNSIPTSEKTNTFPVFLQLSRLFVYTLAVIFTVSASAATKTTISSGNWTDASIWSPSGVPASTDNVSISAQHSISIPSDVQVHHIVINSGASLTIGSGKRITISGNLQILGTMNMNKGFITLTSPGLNFTIGNGGKFIWDPAANTEAEATLFTNGTEYFDQNSTLVIKNWFNYTIPLGQVVHGSFGNLEVNTPGGQSSIVEWNQQNYFETHRINGQLTIDMGWITLDKTGSISSTYIGSLLLKNVNSAFYAHNGTHPSAFNLTIGSVTNNGGTFYGLNDGNGNITVSVTGDFTNSGNVKIINNSGIPNVSNGNANFYVNGTFAQTTGDTRILYNIATTSSGLMNANFGNLTVNGGIFMGQSACHTAGGLSTITVLGNLNINLQNNSDKFRGTSLTSIGSSINNTRFNLTVNGNVNLNGVSASEFTSSASQGEEKITIYGNLNLSGSTANINYGMLNASHYASLQVRGKVTMSGGNVFLSRNNGRLDASFGAFTQSGGTMAVKAGTGIASVIVGAGFNMSNGSFLCHSNTVTATSDNIDIFVNGNFAQSGGTFRFDDNASSSAGRMILHLLGDSCNFSGNAAMISGGNSSGGSFGTIRFDKVGVINFSRTGVSAIDQVVQQIETGCTVKMVQGNMIVSGCNQSGVNFLILNKGGKLELKNAQIITSGSYSGSSIFADSASVISLTRSQGWYDNATSGAFCKANGFAFNLHPYSIIEYNSSGSQNITGITSGSPDQMKYGVLRINITGDSIYRANITSNDVIVRTRLELINGGMMLNGNKITLENGNSDAVKRDKGYMNAEPTSSVGAGTFIWKNIQRGEHIIPFGISPSVFIPAYINPKTGFGSTLTAKTWSTSKDNLPFPDASIVFAGGNTFANDQVLDRWWNFTAPGMKADATLSYRGTENTLDPKYLNGKISLAQWTGSWTISDLSAPLIKSGTSYLKMTNMSLNSSVTAICQFSDSRISLDATLGVSSVLVYWSNEEEENVTAYMIERSSDGVNYETVGSESGSSVGSNKYAFDDLNYPQGITYYRIRGVMKDGSSLYSKRVAVQPLSAGSEKALSIISVSPNPFSETLKINLQVPIDESLMITIWSTDGKLLRTQEESFQKGSQQIELNSLDAMPAGNYILKVSGGNQNTSKNIIKY